MYSEQYRRNQMLTRNAGDVLEDVLRWPIAALIWGVALPIVAVNFVFLGGWLSIAPGIAKEAKT